MAGQRGIVIALLLLLGSHCTSTMPPPARLVVGVTDSRCGYALPAVSITATSGMGAEVSAISDAAGRAILQLPAGTWRVVGTLPGMRSPAPASTTLHRGDEASLTIALDPQTPGSTTFSPHGDCRPPR
jgi:hypothetical protein